MIISMTGFGKAVQQLADKKITCEIRTLNSKNLDLNIRISNSFKSLELPLRKIAAQNLHRGKVDLAVHIENNGGNGITQLNIDALETYIQQLADIKGVSLEDDRLALLKIASSFPDVIATPATEPTEEDMDIIKKVAAEALLAVVKYRKEEGSVLQMEFNKRITNIKVLLQEVIEEDRERLAEIRTRLEKAVSEIKERVDENRFEQELIYYLEKYDITEEKVRLENHLDYFISTMDAEEAHGKKLAFISQEIGREINTIGSKANHAGMQQMVVQMKDELEKVKEQLLNVL
ncbi:YicC/YloC family endoribonuclease [Nonlabens xiamenensis]|uniref:YicC/YloC family endoribonuclease n=1 Tax=Nonlabens xiamenensis TaxID=2341043 RepID=UPI000F615C20|nr:YicC/YloC family endoribonuclease [Nonlabens xiamenensis]